MEETTAGPSGGKLMVEKRIHLLAYPLVPLAGEEGRRGAQKGMREKPPDVRRDEK